MTRRSILVLPAIVAGVIVGASSLRAGSDRNKPKKPEDVVLIGKVVDLQSFMTSKFSAGDPVRTTQDCIRQGVPAALATEEGLIVIGMGDRGPSRILLPLAMKNVEIKGRLYEKDGIQYIDMVSASPIKEEEEAKEEPEHAAEEEDAEEEHPEEEEPEGEP